MNANALKFTQITLSLPKYTQKIKNSKVCSQFRLIIFVPEHFVNTLGQKKTAENFSTALLHTLFQ